MRRRLSDIINHLIEVREFVTPGKSGKGKYDFVGIVLEKYFNAIPEFRKSEVEREPRKNGWTISGSWPTSGRHVFDWQLEAWGEPSGDVIVRTIFWDVNGRQYGDSYRSTVASSDKAVSHWMRKFAGPTVMKLKKGSI